MIGAPSVGIFWVVLEDGRPVLLADVRPLAEAEPYGDFLTHGGHYEFWNRLSGDGATALRRRGLPTAPAWSEYEEWPRGRVVFHRPTRRAVLYADRRLRTPSWVSRIAERFGWSLEDCDVRGDPHYVSVRAV